MLTHPFSNPKSDGGDATVTRPSDWNASHVMKRVSTRDETIPASCSVILSDDYEIGSGFFLEIGLDSAMEIS
jgi:hypothetical protein